MGGLQVLDQQSVPPGYFLAVAPPTRYTGISPTENWRPDSSRKERVKTQRLSGLAEAYQDFTLYVERTQGTTIELKPVEAEETRVSAQLARAKDVLRRLQDSKKRVQQLEKFAAETRWLAENGHKYAGRWVALEGDQLLAEGATAKEVFSKVEGQATPPLVIRVAADDLPFAGW